MLSRSYTKLFVSPQFWVMVFLLAFVCMPLIYPVKFPVQFWIKQAFDFAIWGGVFFFSGYILAPKVIFRGQILFSIIIVIAIMVGVVWVDTRLDDALHLKEAMDKTFGNKQHEMPHLGSFIALIVTLLLIGIGTISAVVQRFQADRLKEQVMEQEKIVSELSFLKTQINPHFFFNVLNTIYALIGSNATAAQESVYTLSRMMRYVLYDTKHDRTTLEKEIAFIDDYIQLMRLRLPDAVQVIFEKPATPASVELSPMLFLPYIENAFKHGISSLHPSYIYIEIAQSNNNELFFEIRNSLFKEQPENKEESNGIGLKNTQRRLDLLYPDKHTLLVEKDEDAHEFVVKLKLQLQ
ncbi:MAG: histidine kinase [Mucilaginibacter sp.]|nr:histidine kinase [Mucilaginibacter sp.]